MWFLVGECVGVMFIFVGVLELVGIFELVDAYAIEWVFFDFMILGFVLFVLVFFVAM